MTLKPEPLKAMVTTETVTSDTILQTTTKPNIILTTTPPADPKILQTST